MTAIKLGRKGARSHRPPSPKQGWRTNLWKLAWMARGNHHNFQAFHALLIQYEATSTTYIVNTTTHQPGQQLFKICDPKYISGALNSFQKPCSTSHCLLQSRRKIKFYIDVSSTIMLTTGLWHWKNISKCKQTRPSKRTTLDQYLVSMFSATDSLKANGVVSRYWCLDVHLRRHATPPLVPTTGVNCHQQLFQRRFDTSVDQTMRGGRHKTPREQQRFVNR